MATPMPSRRINMRNLPSLSRTPGSATPIIRSLPKEVFLYEWWLVRAAAASKGNHLHVAGFTSRGRQVMEIFHSAAIVKRHGTVTLESVDGITISISGLINRFRTLENGFSKEVCDEFLLGFPYNWEEFATASDRVSPSEANPQLGETRSSLKYRLPVSFEDIPAVAIQDLLTSIPEDSESSMMNIVVENIRKSYAGSSCSGGMMTDRIKSPCSSCTGGKMTNCSKEDAFIHVVTETTSSVARRVDILQNPGNVITPTGAGVRDNMNSKSEKPLGGSCVDSHASINMAGACVREYVSTASEKCLEGSLFNSHASKIKCKTLSGKEGHMGSLVEDSKANKNEKRYADGSSKDLSVDYVVPQSCNKSNKSNKTNIGQKKRGGPPKNDMSMMRVTRSMKRQRKTSFQDTSAMQDEGTPAIVLDTPERQPRVPLSRCQVSSTSELSKAQYETQKVEESQKTSTLRRSRRLQNRKQYRS